MKDLKRFWCTLLRRDNQALTAGFVPSGAPHPASLWACSKALVAAAAADVCTNWPVVLVEKYVGISQSSALTLNTYYLPNTYNMYSLLYTVRTS